MQPLQKPPIADGERIRPMPHLPHVSVSDMPAQSRSSLPIIVISSLVCSLLTAVGAIYVTLLLVDDRLKHAPAPVIVSKTPETNPAVTDADQAVKFSLIDGRFRKVATVQVNMLERITELEKEQSRARLAEKAAASARRDMQLRLESLGSDFRRMPDTAFAQPGFTQ